MAKEVIDLLAPKLRGILRILHMPDVKDEDMRELIIRLGQTKKQIPDVHRTSRRLASHSLKRSYVAMQGPSGAGRPKRTKLPGQKPKVNDYATIESASSVPTVESPATNEFIIDDLFVTEPAVDDSNEIEALQALATDSHHICADEILSPDGIYPTKHDDENFGQPVGGDIPAITHDDGMAILDGYFLNSPADLGSADMLALDTLLGSEDENISPDSPLATVQSNTSRPFPASYGQMKLHLRLGSVVGYVLPGG